MANIAGYASRSLSWLVRVAPAALAGVAGYYLFLIILPFFALGVYRVPLRVLWTGEVWYADALGLPAMAFTLLLELSVWLVTYMWLLSVANFVRTRSIHVLVLLALAPLPIAYVNAGPYAAEIKYWILAL